MRPEGRSLDRDIVIAHHEAAHAVTAEYVAPGSVLGVCIDGEVPGYRGVSTGDYEVLGQVVWDLDRFPTAFEEAVAIAASRPGERLVAGHVDPTDTPFKGDDRQLEQCAGKLKGDALLTSYEVVRGNDERIRRLADVLLEQRSLTGEAVRRLMTESQTESQRTRSRRRLMKVFKGPDPKPVKKPKKGKK